MKSKIDSQYVFIREDRACQGDIFRDLKYNYQTYKDLDGSLTVDEIIMPYAVVLSQDCDLESDYRNRQNEGKEQTTQDKYLHSILISPAYLAEELRLGTHLSGPGFGVKMEYHNHSRWNIIKDNKNERYHYLEANLEMQIPNLAIDFKHHFTVARNQLYESKGEHYIATLNELYREALSQRFAYYVSRIGLPEMKYSETIVAAK